MRESGKYLAYGLLVVASYWFTVHNGIVYWSVDQTPSAPGGSGGSGVGVGRSHPSFWGGGFQGGK